MDEFKAIKEAYENALLEEYWLEKILGSAQYRTATLRKKYIKAELKYNKSKDEEEVWVKGGWLK